MSKSKIEIRGYAGVPHIDSNDLMQTTEAKLVVKQVELEAAKTEIERLKAVINDALECECFTNIWCQKAKEVIGNIHEEGE